MAALKRKIHDKNPHVAKFGLIVSICCSSEAKKEGYMSFVHVFPFYARQEMLLPFVQKF